MDSVIINDELSLGGIIFRPRPGRLYIRARGNEPKVNGEISLANGSGRSTLGFHLMIPHFDQIHHFGLEWRKLMPIEEAKTRKLSILFTYKQNKDGQSQDMAIVNRLNGCQYYMFVRETHPFFMDVLSSVDGGRVEFAFRFVIRIVSLGKILEDFGAGDFLTSFVETNIIDAIRAVTQGKSFKEMLGLKEIPTKKKIIKELNVMFGADRAVLEDIMFEYAGAHADSSGLLKAMEDARKAQSEAEATKTRAGATAEATRLTAIADANAIKTKAGAEAERVQKTGDAETNVQKKRTAEVGAEQNKVQKEALKNKQDFYKDTKADPTSIEVAEKLKDLKGTLVLGKDNGVLISTNSNNSNNANNNQSNP